MNIRHTHVTKTNAFDFGAMVLDALLIEPDRCAFRFKGKDLNRGDLRQQAIALASRLRKAGYQPGDAVALEIEHTLELPIAMCGVQAAGGCAVPIDPSISAERRAAIYADMRPKFILRRVQGAENKISIEHGTDTSGTSAVLDRDLAFVVYTSGSSGGPKGVMISQETYVRRMNCTLPTYGVQDDDIDLAWTPSSFVVMLDEIFLPILTRVQSVIASPDLRVDPMAFAALVQSERITSFRMTPSVLGVVLREKTAEALSGVRTIVCSGEPMPSNLQSRTHQLLPSVTLLGFYGATEAPAVATIPFDRNVPPSDATICTPQSFVPIRVVNEAGTDVATGQTGEIWLGGVAVARGYFNRPELTAEKFVVRQNERWYRTGDLGRSLSGGQLEILGRLDMSEVNINGARVNLPEIVAALHTHPGIVAAWISAVTKPGQTNPTLVAHCVPEDMISFDPTAVRKDLASILPSQGVPLILHAIDALPLTDNGKIDARRLKVAAATLLDDSDLEPRGANNPVSPRMPEKTGVSKKWEWVLPVVLSTAQDLLKGGNLKGEDNFFASGGDSLKAVHLALELEERLACKIKPTVITNTDSFHELAQAIASGRNDKGFAARLVRDGAENEAPIFTINDRRRYEILAPQLTMDAQVWNLDLFSLTEHDLSGLDTFTLKELAEKFADEVLAVQPNGTWRLLAFCQSACLAIEIARVLQSRTGQVSHLLLIDAFFTEYLPTPKVHFGRLLDFGPSYYTKRILSRFGLVKYNAAAEDISDQVRAELLETADSERAVLRRRFWDLNAAYPVSPYDGPVSLFVSEEFRHNSRKSALRLATQGLSVLIVQGLHLTVFQAKNNKQDLAQAIESHLAEQTT